jgi:hypothetical protein
MASREQRRVEIEYLIAKSTLKAEYQKEEKKIDNF